MLFADPPGVLISTTVTLEPSGLITAPSMYLVVSRTSADCRRSSRLLLRLPPCPAGLTARTSSPLPVGLHGPLMHRGMPRNASSRPSAVNDKWPTPNAICPGTAGPLCHTARAPVRVLITVISADPAAPVAAAGPVVTATSEPS